MGPRYIHPEVIKRGGVTTVIQDNVRTTQLTLGQFMAHGLVMNSDVVIIDGTCETYQLAKSTLAKHCSDLHRRIRFVAPPEPPPQPPPPTSVLPAPLASTAESPPPPSTVLFTPYYDAGSDAGSDGFQIVSKGIKPREHVRLDKPSSDAGMGWENTRFEPDWSKSSASTILGEKIVHGIKMYLENVANLFKGLKVEKRIFVIDGFYSCAKEDELLKRGKSLWGSCHVCDIKRRKYRNAYKYGRTKLVQSITKQMGPALARLFKWSPELSWAIGLVENESKILLNNQIELHIASVEADTHVAKLAEEFKNHVVISPDGDLPFGYMSVNKCLRKGKVIFFFKNFY